MKHLANNKIISLKQWVAKRNAKEQQKAQNLHQPLKYQESSQHNQEIDDDMLFTGMLIWQIKAKKSTILLIHYE